MIRNITKGLVFILTILLAEIAVDYVRHLIKIKTGTHDVYLKTLIGMGVIVGVFYPVFKFTEYIVEELAEHFVAQAKKKSGDALLGLIIAFVIGFGALYLVYLHEWYGKTLW